MPVQRPISYGIFPLLPRHTAALKLRKRNPGVAESLPCPTMHKPSPLGPRPSSLAGNGRRERQTEQLNFVIETGATSFPGSNKTLSHSSDPRCLSQSPGVLFKTLMPTLYPPPINSDSLGLGHGQQCLLPVCS